MSRASAPASPARTGLPELPAASPSPTEDWMPGTSSEAHIYGSNTATRAAASDSQILEDATEVHSQVSGPLAVPQNVDAPESGSSQAQLAADTAWRPDESGECQSCMPM